MGKITKDNFLLVGISHKTAPVEVREKVSFADSAIPRVMQGICALPGVAECVLLSTCNRTEVYSIVTAPADEARRLIENHIAEASGVKDEVSGFFYSSGGEKTFEHLFKVVSGLDSMILGEPQIFGQVKNAYSAACDAKCTGPALNRLFHTAFRVGKRIRSMTAIGEGAVSVSFAAVERARAILGDLCGRSVLLVGAGKTGELSAKGLRDTGVGHLYIANRTQARAHDLAERLNGEAVLFESMLELTGEVDIMITSVTTNEPIIARRDIEPHLSERGGKPLLIIDLGVPRNIDQDVAGMEYVSLLNIDDLEGLTLDNLDKRKNEAEKGEELIAGEVEDFSTWLSEREVIPVIRSLNAACENIRLDELEKIKNRVDGETLEVIDLVTRRIVRKLLHNPVITMRETESGEGRERLLKSVRELFIKDTDRE